VRRVLREDVRDVHAVLREEIANLEERPPSAVVRLLHLLGTPAFGDEHRHGGLPLRQGEAEVATRRSAAGHGRERELCAEGPMDELRELVLACLERRLRKGGRNDGHAIFPLSFLAERRHSSPR